MISIKSVILGIPVIEKRCRLWLVRMALFPILAVLLALPLPVYSQIDLSFANLMESTDVPNPPFGLGPGYSGTTMHFTDVAPGSGLSVDMLVTVTNVSTPQYYYEVSIPDYKSTTGTEPNGDLGYLYYHDDGSGGSSVGGLFYNLEFFEGGGTFTTPKTMPAFQFLIYDVDGESVQSEAVRVFSLDGFVGYGITAGGVTVQDNGFAYLFTGPGTNRQEDDPSGAFVLIYENTSKVTFQMESDTDDSDADSNDNPVFSAIDGDLSLINGDASDFEPFTRVSGSISGTVFTDIDNNGTGDFPIAGVTLTLKTDSGADIDSDPLTSGLQPYTTMTQADGSYLFDNVPVGDFRVDQTQPIEYTSVSDTDGANNNIIGDETAITVVADTENTGNNFVEEAPQSISGTVVLDGDVDGTGEAALPGVTVQLLDIGGSPVDGDSVTPGVQPIVAVTDANGDYYLPVPTPDTYLVEILASSLPTSMPVSFDPSGALDGSGTVVVASAANLIDVDFGYTGAILTGNVFSDRDNDGSKDGLEPGLSGIDITITDIGAGVQTVTTDSSGNYSAIVPIGTTNVDVVNGTVPSGYTLTTSNDPLDVGVVTGGSVAPDIGYYNPQAVTGHVFYDIDGNGVQGPNEPDIAGADILVTDSAAGIQVVTTDANGDYIANVPVGATSVDVFESTVAMGAILTTANDPQSVSVTSGNTIASAAVGYRLPVLAVLKSADTVGPVGTSGSVDYTVTVYNNDSVTHTGIDLADTVTNGAVDYGTGVTVSAPPTGTLTTNITDDLESELYTGGSPTSGAPAWVGNWLEIGEADGAAAGDVHILLDGVSESLQVQGSSNGLQRALDLSGRTSATISFESRRKDLTAAADYVTIDVSNDGMAWFEIGRIEGVDGVTTTDTTYQTQSPITIPLAYLTNTARIRFFSSATLGAAEIIYVDDIVVAANLSTAQTGMPGTTAPDLGTDYILDSGQSITFTYTSTVDGNLATTMIDNAAGVTSDQQGTAQTSSASVTVANGSLSGSVLVDTDNDNDGDLGLGAQLALLDDTGNPVDDPHQSGVQDYIVTADALTGAYSFTEVGPGDYRVSQEQPSGYVSVSDADGANNNLIGDETAITVTANTDTPGNDFIEERESSIGDRLWVDEDADGVFDAGEVGLGDVRVFLDTNANGALDDGEAWTVTDSNGFYLFTGVAAGTYNVTVDTGIVSGSPPSGLLGSSLSTSLAANPTYNEDTGTTSPDHTTSVTVAVGAMHDTADFGYHFASAAETNDPGSVGTPLGALGHRVWNDADADGVQDPGEAGIGSVTVNLLTDPDGDSVYTASGITTTTSANGEYVFDALSPGSYVVEVDTSTLPAAFDTTPTGDPDGDFNSVSNPIIIAPGDTYLNANFGYDTTAGGSVIGDRIYLDANGNGVRNSGSDPGLAGVSVVLLDSNGRVVATVLTNNGGLYRFNGVEDGTYTVWVNDSDNRLSAFSQTGDPDSTLDRRSTVVVNSGVSTTYNANDFGFAPLSHGVGDGFIGDTIFLDRNANGTPNGGEGIEGVVVELYDSLGTTLLVTTVTNADGRYAFGGLDAAATYVVKVDAASLPGGLSNTVDPDGGTVNEASVDLSALGGSSVTQDFGYNSSGDTHTISGTLFSDIDASGVRDGAEVGDLSGVTVELFDVNGNSLGFRTTNNSGNFSFLRLPAGTYTVVVTDTANVLDGYWHSLGTSATANNHSKDDAGYVVTVSGGSNDNTSDFGYYREGGTIGDYVWSDANADGVQEGSAGIANALVTLTIAYPGGSSVTVATLTDANGLYSFKNLLADEDYNTATAGNGSDPTYTVTFTAPSGRGPSPTGAGTAATDSNGLSDSNITLGQGQIIDTIDSGFVLKDSFGNWVTSYALGSGDDGPTDNPDGDIWDNTLEYAFCIHPESGQTSRSPFCAEAQLDGSIDVVFYRLSGGLNDVSYQLEGSAVLADPTSWRLLKTAPGSGTGGDSSIVITDQGDGTEEVRIDDIASLGTVTNQLGFVRLGVVLSSPANTSYTYVFGWNETTIHDAQCETFGNPFLNKEVFSGVVDSITGMEINLDVTSGVGIDFSAMLDVPNNFYIEVISGDLIGHRFDLKSGSLEKLEIASDSDLCAGPPFSTMLTAASLPALLEGDSFVLREHFTVATSFPPVSPFVAESTYNETSTDRILLNNGTWEIFYIKDVSGTPTWSSVVGDVDVSDRILPPCQGLFLHPQHGNDIPILAMGVVRETIAYCPLDSGYNLLAPAHPVDGSPEDRGLTAVLKDGESEQLTGNLNPSSSDQILVWLGNVVPASYKEAYTSFFYLPGNGGSRPTAKWVDVTDFLTTSKNTDDSIFLKERAVFILRRATGCDDTFILPANWTR